MHSVGKSSITASHLLYRGASPAHFEDGAAGLYDGHQDQGGDTGNYHVELHIGVNLSWLAPLITVVWCYWNDKYCSPWAGKYFQPTNIVERQRLGVNLKMFYFACLDSFFQSLLHCQRFGVCVELVLVNDDNQSGVKFTLTSAVIVEFLLERRFKADRKRKQDIIFTPLTGWLSATSETEEVLMMILTIKPYLYNPALSRHISAMRIKSEVGDRWCQLILPVQVGDSHIQEARNISELSVTETAWYLLL